METLTVEQKKGIEQGICPKCNKLMVQLKPANIPNKAELYCEPCHYSYPLFDR